MAEIRIEDQIVVDASPSTVWNAIKDPAAHAEWHPFVTRIDGEHRLGAIRACHVKVGKTSGRTRERCITDDEGRTIVWSIEEDSTGFLRLVSDWTAGFLVVPRDARVTDVTAHSAFRPKNLLARLILPVVRRKFHKTQQAILGALKLAAERETATMPRGGDSVER
jgi:uncharacterized protein YndB with AHSA1/START domain